MKFYKEMACILLLYFTIIGAFGSEEHLASKFKAEQVERIRCGYNLKTLWTAEVAHSPFAAAPLIADVNGDGTQDVVAAPFSETLTLLSAETGTTPTKSAWPSQKLDGSFHASPLQYDVDGDGTLDLLFTTSAGELVFYKPDGTLVYGKHMQLPPLLVKRDWYKEVLTVSHPEVHNYVVKPADQNAQTTDYIPLDPHVLATPVIGDLDNDGYLDDLVIPVTYFFEEEDYRLPETFKHLGNMTMEELKHYVVSGVTIVNLKSLEVKHQIFLDLTQATSIFPAYNLFSPTIIDLDSDNSPLEIVVATSAGKLYALDARGRHREGFPISVNSIHGQVTVADVTGDGKLEMVVIDTSGNVACINHDGVTLWEAEISGTSSPGSRLLDVNADGMMDLVIPTNKGDVYALSGKDGAVVEGWPVRVGKRIPANILATKLSSSHSALDLVFLDDDGVLHIVSSDLKCRAHFPVGETSLVQILSHDLVSDSDGLELLISTNDGALICLGTGLKREVFFDEDAFKAQLLQVLPSETKSPNDFTFSTQKTGIYVYEISRSQKEITGSRFDVELEIIDPTYQPSLSRHYHVRAYFGSNLLYSSEFSKPGVTSLSISTWYHSGEGHVTVYMTNQHGQIFQDTFYLRFNKLILMDLQWLLLAPFVAMVIILLVNHGFPSKDLLPYTFQSKDR